MRLAAGAFKGSEQCTHGNPTNNTTQRSNTDETSGIVMWTMMYWPGPSCLKWINLYPVDNAVLVVSPILIHWIMFYLLIRAIHSLNNLHQLERVNQSKLKLWLLLPVPHKDWQALKWTQYSSPLYPWQLPHRAPDPKRYCFRPKFV